MLQTSWPSHTNFYIGWDIPKSTSYPGVLSAAKLQAMKGFLHQNEAFL